MKKCVFCGTILNDGNKSEEHIIHNAIGGRLKNDEICCKKCNQQYGAYQDKEFIKIFAPIVDKINTHNSRNTKGTPYTGIMCDQYGNMYTAIYKNGKVIKLEDSNSEYVKYEKDKYYTLSYDFKFNNDAFKLGISKIAFNYAIHCGLDSSCLEKVFDYSNKKFINELFVIPFFPISSFDDVMESYQVKEIFHTVRIFNVERILYAYVELFNTFQYYILLSEKYNIETLGDIDNSYCNVVQKYRFVDEELKKSMRITDYKDLHIISTQYDININKEIEMLKEYHNYDEFKDNSKNTKNLFDHIRKLVYEKVRKKSYIKKYNDMVNDHFNSIDFWKNFQNSKNIEEKSTFLNHLRFYVDDNDFIRMKRYKKILPDGSIYPISIVNYMISEPQKVKSYGHKKFNMLQEVINK